MYTLFYAPGTSSLPAHIALEETGVPYQSVLIDVRRGEQRHPSYLAINPRGRVPALKIGDEVLTESVALLMFLTRKHLDPQPGTPDAMEEARVVSLLSYFATTVHPAFSHWVRADRFTDEASALAGIQDKALGTFRHCCTELDSMLAGREWLLDGHTVADGYALLAAIWALRVGFAMEDFRHLSAHRDRMLARDAVRRVLAKENLLSSFAPG